MRLGAEFIADKPKAARLDHRAFLQRVINDWLDEGGELYELLEPVDSLHPTQAAQPLIAKALWSVMERDMPDVLGPRNHRNHLIREMFGNQNGH